MPEEPYFDYNLSLFINMVLYTAGRRRIKKLAPAKETMFFQPL